MKHTAECLEAAENRDIENRAWKERWPKHCQTCCGSGEFNGEPCFSCVARGEFFHDVTPDGHGDFLYAGRCPRCGGSAPLTWKKGKKSPCLACGWNWGRGKGDQQPYPAECSSDPVCAGECMWSEGQKPTRAQLRFLRWLAEPAGECVPEIRTIRICEKAGWILLSPRGDEIHLTEAGLSAVNGS